MEHSGRGAGGKENAGRPYRRGLTAYAGKACEAGGRSIEEQDRIPTGYPELDRVLGSGIVAGSLVLVGGDPGIGKSTLLLQMCRNLAGMGTGFYTFPARNL